MSGRLSDSVPASTRNAEGETQFTLQLRVFPCNAGSLDTCLTKGLSKQRHREDKLADWCTKVKLVLKLDVVCYMKTVDAVLNARLCSCSSEYRLIKVTWDSAVEDKVDGATWWMVPRGKYSMSPGCRMTSRMGSPMSLSVKLGLDPRGRVSAELLHRGGIG